MLPDQTNIANPNPLHTTFSSISVHKHVHQMHILTIQQALHNTMQLIYIVLSLSHSLIDWHLKVSTASEGIKTHVFHIQASVISGRPVKARDSTCMVRNSSEQQCKHMSLQSNLCNKPCTALLRLTNSRKTDPTPCSHCIKPSYCQLKLTPSILQLCAQVCTIQSHRRTSSSYRDSASRNSS